MHKVLIAYFVYNLEAITIASLTHLRNTIKRYLMFIRKRIAEFCEQRFQSKGKSKLMNPTSALKGLKANGSLEHLRKHRFLGIFKRGVKAYTEVVPDCAKITLQAMIRGHFEPD